MKKIRVGLNGFGRIGRAIFRNNLEKKYFDIVVINDINPDINNLAYTLNYDTLYDRLSVMFRSEGDSIVSDEGHIVKITHEQVIDDVNWAGFEVDYVIDCSGVLKNVLHAKNLVSNGKVKKVFITHSPEPVDFTLVLGANESELDLTKHHVIASSICDATAIAPVMKIINGAFGIESGYVTTLHPWLNYQNLLDGAASSWSMPGEIYHHFALGRSTIGNLIPKPTTAISASCKVLGAEKISEEMIGSFSFRTPTPIVGSADITLQVKKDISAHDVISVFETFAKQQKWHIIQNNLEPLVSLDFKKSDYSAVVDHRWTNVINKRMLKLVLWYDNEWGYSSRVLDQVMFVAVLS